MQASEVDEYTGKIPRILHYIYLSGFDAYIAETKKPRAKLQTWYRETCEVVHKHWKIMFWTEEMAYELVSTKFPEFLPIWHSYDMEVVPAKLAGTQSASVMISCNSSFESGDLVLLHDNFSQLQLDNG